MVAGGGASKIIFSKLWIAYRWIFVSSRNFWNYIFQITNCSELKKKKISTFLPQTEPADVLEVFWKGKETNDWKPGTREWVKFSNFRNDNESISHRIPGVFIFRNREFLFPFSGIFWKFSVIFLGSPRMALKLYREKLIKIQRTRPDSRHLIRLHCG